MYRMIQIYEVEHLNLVLVFLSLRLKNIKTSKLELVFLIISNESILEFEQYTHSEKCFLIWESPSVLSSSERCSPNLVAKCF